jgi:hypothetical protein
MKSVGAASTARVSSLGGFRAQRRLTYLLRGYDDLEELHQTARAALAESGEAIEVDAWHEVVLALLEANLGASTMRAYLRISEHWPDERPVADLVSIGRASARIGRDAGGSAVRALFAELPGALWRLPSSAELAKLLGTLEQLATSAPESVPLVASRLPRLLASVDAAGFEAWVLGGIRSCGTNVLKRRSYFALDDPLSLHLLDLGGAGADFTRLEKRIAINLAALWGKRPPLRALRASPGMPAARRASLVGGLLRFPQGFPGVAGEAAEHLYLAAAAHAGAHLTYSTARFPVGKLKPLQVALVSLVEDARVEALALCDLPGLARLFGRWHQAQPSGTTAPVLMARLARALLDPSYQDAHAWVSKGRELFAAARSRLADPAISREIGGLLGNDLGQMRVQFNARTYVVEPPYRDDNLALWDFGDQPDAPTETLELMVDSVRVERREEENAPPSDETPQRNEKGRARPREVTALEGIPVATYPEWDYALGHDRPAWTTILECEAPVPQQAGETPGVFADDAVARRVSALARGASIGRRMRARGRLEGDTLDIDACIASAVARRAGLPPEARVFQTDMPGQRDLSVLLLIDLSESTADPTADGRSVLEIEREAATILAAAFEAAGDALAVHGFSSDGREKVRYLRLKDFAEPFDAVARARLAGLVSSHSTRLGAAVRHAGSYLADQRAFRRVLLVLTDGEPSDIDVSDPAYLAEDARRAVLALRKTGIDVFAFGLGSGSFRALDRIVGERYAPRVPRIETLPARVMQLYTELKK